MIRERAVRRLQHRLTLIAMGQDSPEKFRAIAKWWSLEAIYSSSPEQHINAAMAQLFIAIDMENRPRHHGQKPTDKTRWEWSQCK